jgi:TetR/AcrR family transcriptional regulator
MPKKTTKPTTAAKSRKPRDKTSAAPALDAEAKILEAARSVFIRRGTAGARMQEIAAEAGVNQALLHYYFRSKDQLAAAVFGQMAAKLFPALLLSLSSNEPLDAKIEQLIALYHENLSRNPFLPGYVLSEMHHHPERIQQVIGKLGGAEPRVAAAPMFTKLAEQIDVEVRAGRMRSITPQQFVVNLVSLCIFPFAARPMLGFMLGLDDETFPTFIQERQRTLAEFFRNALRP